MQDSFDEIEREVRAFMRGGPDSAIFNSLAEKLFQLQLAHNPAYARFVAHAGERAIPTSAFKELELTSLRREERTRVFFSSGTTRKDRGCHFHSRRSLAVYEESALRWFSANFSEPVPERMFLTPPPALAPNSSLVRMFATIGGRFIGELDSEGAWIPGNFEPPQQPIALMGTAFLFVHLLDALREPVKLPEGSWVLETGGYKGRSREVPKAELRQLIAEKLGVPADRIFGEYGMSELSSQGYDRANGRFRFPHWARVEIISPSTGRVAPRGERGLIRVWDLANIWSVMAVQTEDIGIDHGDGIELCGRAPAAEARGCSLMSV